MAGSSDRSSGHVRSSWGEEFGVDGNAFDRATRGFATRGSRRRLLGLASGLTLAGVTTALGLGGSDAREHGRNRGHQPGKDKDNRKGKRKDDQLGARPVCDGLKVSDNLQNAIDSAPDGATLTL